MTDTRGWIPIADASKPLDDDSGDFGLLVWGYRHPDDHMPILSDVPASQDPPDQSITDHFASLPAEVQDRAVENQLGMVNLDYRSTGQPSREPMSAEELQELAGGSEEAVQEQPASTPPPRRSEPQEQTANE